MAQVMLVENISYDVIYDKLFSPDEPFSFLLSGGAERLALFIVCFIKTSQYRQ